jgi:putative transposase
VSRVLLRINPFVSSCLRLLQRSLLKWTKPPQTSLLLGTFTDLARGKSELVAENALLRQQLIILRRQIKRPRYTPTDRILLVLLARAVRTWRQALLIVQPETLLTWHRQLFRLYWKHLSKPKPTRAKVAAETIALIKEMASNNRRLPSGTDPWRITQVGDSCQQTHDPEAHATRAHTSIKRTELEDLPPQPR